MNEALRYAPRSPPWRSRSMRFEPTAGSVGSGSSPRTPLPTRRAPARKEGTREEARRPRRPRRPRSRPAFAPRRRSTGHSVPRRSRGAPRRSRGAPCARSARRARRRAPPRAPSQAPLSPPPRRRDRRLIWRRRKPLRTPPFCRTGTSAGEGAAFPRGRTPPARWTAHARAGSTPCRSRSNNTGSCSGTDSTGNRWGTRPSLAGPPRARVSVWRTGNSPLEYGPVSRVRPSSRFPALRSSRSPSPRSSRTARSGRRPKRFRRRLSRRRRREDAPRSLRHQPHLDRGNTARVCRA
jgi:hypothetical protein